MRLFLHIMGNTMYTSDTFAFINTCFDGSEHQFANGVLEKSILEEMHGVDWKHASIPKIIRPKNLFSYIRALKRSDGIILHGAFSAKHLLILSWFPKLLPKVNWVVWGGDIYRHNLPQKSFQDRLAEKLRVKLAPQFGYITTLTDKDYPLAKEWYKVTGKWLKASYPVPLQHPGTMEKLRALGLQKHKTAADTVNLVLGNSATETNCHFEALQMLKKYADHNIKLYLPLNYGFKGYEAYADKVVKAAQEIFGEQKVIAIRERMDGDSYVDFLSQMDIAVMNNNRQQAMGNIAILIACGAKVYIRQDTTMWQGYQEKGYHLESVSQIDEEDYASFIRYDEEIKNANMQCIADYVDIRHLKDKWETIFRSMKELDNA